MLITKICSLQVEVNAFIREQSLLGIEYINLLDTAIKTPECTPANSNYDDKSLPVWAWVLIACALVLLLIIVISIGVYCLYDKRRKNLKIGTNK